jgi:DNA primase
MSRAPIPAFPIGLVLEALGAESVPTGHGWRKMPCFLHPDRTPSAAVNHDVNGYKCHSCEVSGDPIKVVREVERLSFKDALAFCEEATGEVSADVSRTGWGGTELSL